MAFYLRADAPHPSAFAVRLVTVALTWDSALGRICTDAAKQAKVPLNAWLVQAIKDATTGGDVTDLLLADLDAKDRIANCSKTERYGTKIPEPDYKFIASICDYLEHGRYPRPKHGALLRAAALIRCDREGLIPKAK